MKNTKLKLRILKGLLMLFSFVIFTPNRERELFTEK